MIRRSESPDPPALAIGAGRIAIGAGVLLAPRASLRALGALALAARDDIWAVNRLSEGR